MNTDTERGVIYIPSFIEIQHKFEYSIELNKSGRLQYYFQPAGGTRKRITKTVFSKAYNHQRILAIIPVQSPSDQPHFLMRFYTN